MADDTVLSLILSKLEALANAQTTLAERVSRVSYCGGYDTHWRYRSSLWHVVVLAHPFLGNQTDPQVRLWC